MLALDRAFPNYQDTPTQFTQRIFTAKIAFYISLDLFLPELLPGSGPAKQMAIVAVPEAAVYQHNDVPAREHQIGSARKLPIMQSVSVTQSVQRTANQKFGLGIFAANSGHHPAANIWGYYIRQLPPPVRLHRPMKVQVPPTDHPIAAPAR